MYILFIVLVLITAVLLIGVVLIQKSKGGGLASSFAGANQVMGVRHTNSFIEKLTWWLVGLMVLFSICATFSFTGSRPANDIRVQQAPVQQQAIPTGDFNSNLPAPAAAPAATPAPAAAETPAPAAETPAAQ